MSGLLPRAQPWAQHELRKVHPTGTNDAKSVREESMTRRDSSGSSGKKLTLWTIIAEKTGVQNTKERLKSFWTTLGVVSALMAALTYPAVTTPTVSKHSNDVTPGSTEDPIYISFILLNMLSLILSFVVVIISVILLAEIDLVLTDEDLELFINRYQYLFLMLTGIFGISMFSIIASIIVAGFYHFSRGTAIAAAAICIFFVVFVGIIAAWVALWTRKRLKLHISEANAKLRAAVARLLKATSGAATPPSVKVEDTAAVAEDRNPRRNPTL